MVFLELPVACADLPVSDSIHNLGLVGHIEDIVVNKDQQGKKLGLRIIEALDYIAEKVGCYKVSSLTFCSAFRAIVPTWSLRWALVRLHAKHCCIVIAWTHFLTPSCHLHALVRHPTPPPFPPTTPTLHSTLTLALANPNVQPLEYRFGPPELTSFPSDNSGLLRNERRLLRQMRLQEGRTGDGTVLRQMTTRP